jgi:hypothetical protein
MKYRVRNQDGELTFDSFGAVEEAWLQGLVDPEDEILEEGTTRWRKCKTIPLLVQARRHGDAVWGGTQAFWIFASISLGSFALYLLVKGHWAIGLVLAVALSLVLTRITYRAFTRSKPYRP